MSVTKIKICGLRSEEDIRIVNRCQPDYAGFICCSRFRRYVPPDTLEQLSKLLHPEIRKVGVFVDQPVEQIAQIVRRQLVDIIQLHGCEDERYISGLRQLIPSEIRIMKAYQIHSAEDICQVEASTADDVLLDGGQGSGQTFDWRKIESMNRPFFLAGGLNPENVEEAVRRLHPCAVDVSSGVETDGHKDEEKVRQLISRVREMNV